MIKTVLFLSIITAALSFLPTQSNNDVHIYKLPEPIAINLYSAMEAAQKGLLVSDIPAKQLVQISTVFDSVKSIIARQNREFYPDTTKKQEPAPKKKK